MRGEATIFQKPNKKRVCKYKIQDSIFCFSLHYNFTNKKNCLLRKRTKKKQFKFLFSLKWMCRRVKKIQQSNQQSWLWVQRDTHNTRPKMEIVHLTKEKWSQQRIALRLGVSEQKIHRYQKILTSNLILMKEVVKKLMKRQIFGLFSLGSYKILPEKCVFQSKKLSFEC